MNKKEISIAKKTLKLLESKSWDNIKLSNILENQNENNIKRKNDIIITINKYFDYLLKQNLSNLETSSSRDMLFEVIMARLDILNLYRKAVKKLIKKIISKPHLFINIIPSFLKVLF